MIDQGPAQWQVHDEGRTAARLEFSGSSAEKAATRAQSVCRWPIPNTDAAVTLAGDTIHIHVRVDHVNMTPTLYKSRSQPLHALGGIVCTGHIYWLPSLGRGLSTVPVRGCI